ncbi:hypothetical protein A1O7_05988 [Cladophialophora yegresii CBS 114405]|uniref:RlpA-like protein double-psi beta-barrel domain-containing protein n=1 Tax=Cladophialophora yegresii CBS 114405 TaxID=1182544 RepID=W9W223_9EURO|nr:uncharacterized protein A1O7_05988 [Cladophialophora yegresii CBS 114405]EXJ58561.1 hypothetical protein A1O7_05988 [Cladophialophora yegresii CBS 114405]
MAVLKNIILAASVLSPLVAAVPMPGPNKRGIYTNTVTEIAWVTVEETTTVWVDPAAPTPAPIAAAITTTSVPAVAQVEPTYTPSTLATLAAAPQQSPSSIPTVAPAAAYTAPAEQASAPASSSSVVPSAASSPSPVSLIAPMMTLQPKAADGSCEGSGNACQGDVTHWDGGLGACGWNVDTSSEMQIALPYGFMGTQSNGNPYCGRSVTLYNPDTGNTVQATVGDKCMGCVDRAIDLTDALFNAIVPGGDGRVSGIQWWLN